MDLVEKIKRSVDKGIVDGTAEVWLTAEECKRIVDALNERPKGKWIDGVCKDCGYDGGTDALMGLSNFCPSCGRDMR